VQRQSIFQSSGTEADRIAAEDDPRETRRAQAQHTLPCPDGDISFFLRFFLRRRSRPAGLPQIAS